MPWVRLIRHAESAANAGLASSDPASIPLTEHGHAQAEALCRSIDFTPALIVVSPFLRALQTAHPALRRFPSIPVETWQVGEFTYLSPARCQGTSPGERRPWVEAYWRDADPHAAGGDDAESFAAFIGRARSALNRLAALPDGPVLMFGHGQFMQAMRWLIDEPPAVVDSRSMRRFREYDLAHELDNCGGFDCRHDEKGWRLSVCE